MNTKRFYWVADCGHEWLAVPEFMARQVDGISSFSYVSPTGDIAYLEGDCDAARFIAHYKLDGAELGATKLYERLAPCRNYPRYECATTTVQCVVCLTDIAASANDDTAICSHCEYNL